MARSLGLPARVAVGYLAQPPDETGTQTIYQINGHSWAEVYFAEYGWVEFEPTAAFHSPQDSGAFVSQTPNSDSERIEDAAAPPIPEQSPIRQFRWQRLLLLILFAFPLGWYWWRQQQSHEENDAIMWAFGRVQKNALQLGHPMASYQTPQEFTQFLLQQLQSTHQKKKAQRFVESIEKPLLNLTTLYEKRRYSEAYNGERSGARRLWSGLKRPFLRLRFYQFLQKIQHKLFKK